MIDLRRLLSRPTSSDDQRGFSLLEILISMGIAALLLVPVGMWMILAMRQQGPTASRFSESAQARVANTYLSRDVGSAEYVKVGDFGTPPGCGTDPDDTVLLQLVDRSDNGTGIPLRTVYVTSDDDALAGATSVYRRTCRLNDTSVVESTTRILRGVRDTPAPSALCPETNCDQVTFSATLTDGGEVNVRAMRRTTVSAGPGDNIPAIAQITMVSVGGQRPSYTAVLDMSSSSDIDGTIASQSWSADGPGPVGIADPTGKQATLTFSVPGTYTATLLVIDDRGAESTASYTIDVPNLAPDVVAGVAPATGRVQGGTETSTFVFNTNGTADADGDSLAGYSWDFGPGVDPASPNLGGPNPAVQFLESAQLGTREVTVTVTDSLGAKSVDRLQIKLVGPGGEDPEAAGPIVISTDGEPGLELVNTAPRSPRAGTVGPGRNVTMTFSTSTAGAFTWELLKGATVVSTASTPSFNHTFGAADAGEWSIRLTPSGGTPISRPFRLNQAPVAAFTTSGSGNAPSSRSFSSAGSNDDSAIVSYRWNFGFFENWVSTATNPSHVFTHPGGYAVSLEVTDDDGASTIVVHPVSVAGTLAAPPAGEFGGNVFSWAAIPGAEQYEVHLTVSDGPGCTASPGPYTQLIAPANTPSLSTAYAGCGVVAKYRLKVTGLSGEIWSPFSPEVARP